MQCQIWIGDHKKWLLQSTEQHVVPQEFDLLSSPSKTCESMLYRCISCLILPSTYSHSNCLKCENQTL